MFEDIHEIAENSAYLKAVEVFHHRFQNVLSPDNKMRLQEKDVSLEMLEQLPPYEDLKDLEIKLRFICLAFYPTHHLHLFASNACVNKHCWAFNFSCRA